MGCLNPEDIEVLVRDQVEAFRAREMWEHLVVCDPCRRLYEEAQANEKALPDFKPARDRSDARESELVDAARRQVEAHAADGTLSMTLPGGDAARPAAVVIPGYEVIDEIHRGGQGVVYRAIQRSTRQKVAIKVLKEGPFAGPADRHRFEREVRILGQLKHPHIVVIHDSGQVAGQLYFVMDYIGGKSLDAYMASRVSAPSPSPSKGKARGITVRETLELFAKICDAVNSAHLNGIIHRDLKPGNIRLDEHGEPRILDFGLAKVPLVDGDAIRWTQTGDFIGSLPWSSPEQAEGKPSKIDVRTDVYSLGVILYQMLTGRFPYDVTGNMRDVLDRILEAEPVRPSTHRRHGLTPVRRFSLSSWLRRSSASRIDDDVETIVLKCLAKERERRYRSAGELGEDIRLYLAGKPILAKRDSAWYVVRKAVMRSVPATVTVLLVALIFVSCIAISVFFHRNVQELAAENTALKGEIQTLNKDIEGVNAKALEELRRARLAAEGGGHPSHEQLEDYSRFEGAFPAP